MYTMITHYVESGARVPGDRLMESSISYLDKDRYRSEKDYPDPIEYLKQVMAKRH